MFWTIVSCYCLLAFYCGGLPVAINFITDPDVIDRSGDRTTFRDP